jgi:hypothetical protein
MGRLSKSWDGKIYKQPTSGAGWEPGTVDWELRRRQIQAQNRPRGSGIQENAGRTGSDGAKGILEGLGCHSAVLLDSLRKVLTYASW